MTIIMYDLADNPLFVFTSYKECAEYFGTSTKSIQSHICRSLKGEVNLKNDKKHNRMVKLYKYFFSDID